jgi:ribose transport system substrate-binding protein
MSARRGRWSGVVTSALCFAALACSGGSENKTAATGDSAGAGGAGGKPIRIAMIAKSSDNPVFLASRTGAEAAAKELSEKSGRKVEVEWMTPGKEDGEVQAQRIRQAVNEGVDAILISCSDAGKVTGAINDAVDRGVQVMTFDSDAPQSKRFAFYGVDDARAGQQTMEELAKLLGGKGNVAILAGNQNAPNLQKRVNGARAEAAKHPGIKIVGVFNHIETPQDASAEVIRVNNAYPEITGWAMIGGWPLFATSLMTELNPARQKVVSVDAIPVQLPYVDKGVVPVLLAQSVYLWGDVSVRTIFEKIHENKAPANPVMPMELVRVSKENLGDWARQLKSWGFTDVDPKFLALPSASGAAASTPAGASAATP